MSHDMTSPDASKSTLAGSGGTKRRQAADSALKREIARTVPSDAEINEQSIPTDDDIRHAVRTWDAAQRDAGTDLEGLLTARVEDDES